MNPPPASPNVSVVANADAARDRLQALSRYARRALEADPAAFDPACIAQPLAAAALEAELAREKIAGETDLKRALRRLRRRVMIAVMARDLAGLAPLAEVVASVSILADLAVRFALDRLTCWERAQYGEPIGEESGRPQQLHVISMGKLGGCELNVSSDIDLVFAYPEEGETRGPQRISNHEFFIRLGRKLIAALSELTADGFVFRVDMRLRPWGDSGPLACGFGMLENYFITQGREWERFAWLKARVIAGERAAELALIAQPFVYRRHLDYAALASLRDLHRQIRQEVARRELHDNIKLGPGGIREIEFIVQLFQLIRGGREPALRERATLGVLPLIAERNLLPAAAAAELTGAYEFLRRLEHRLQYLDDQQTQALPQADEDRNAIADSMGEPSYAALLATLDRHRAAVTAHFDSIFAESAPATHPCTALWEADGEPAAAQTLLAEHGYRNPADALRLVDALRTSPRLRQMSAASQARMAKLVPLAVETAARHANRDATLARLLNLLEAICRREAYLALLLEYPQALDNVARLMSASPWVADYLSRHPILLDELLDPRTLYAAPDWPRAARQLAADLDAAGGDVERQMDLLRHFKQMQTIRLVAQDLAGEFVLEKLSDHLTDLADLILAQVLRVSWAALKTHHREAPRFAIVGYGKLGGKELGYASDLDIIFLYDDDAPEAAENYARLAQRVNAWLTNVTSAGVLYETDLRLRPDGAAGLLVSPLASFEEYQRRHAWVWEHQALTRARFCAGDPAVGARFETIREAVLRQPRALAALAVEIVNMRQKMLDAHPNASGLFDLKHDRGGIIDVEFAVQYLVLGYAHAHRELTGNIGNLALLRLAGRLGLAAEAETEAARAAYRRFRQLQHALRLQSERYARVERAGVATEIAAVTALWCRVLE